MRRGACLNESVRRRRLTAWLLAFPLMVVGSQVAHVLAYRLVYPDAHVRVAQLLATGHGYMGTPAYVPLLLGLVLAAELVWVGSALLSSVRRTLHRPVSPWAFALLPMLGFTLQELLERWLAGSAFPWWMVLQPTFRVGLLLQVPFALLAYVVARVALRAARRAGIALRGAAPRLGHAGASVQWAVRERRTALCAALAGGHSGRGPPRGRALAVIALAR
jgi:hypothetical protein